MTLLRLVRAVHAIAVKLPRAYFRQVNVPNLMRLFSHRDADFPPVVIAIEQAKFNFRRVFGKKRKIDSCTIPRRAQWVGLTWPQFHSYVLWQ
jgi:phosphoketolase